MKKIERETRLEGFMQELNDSAFSNKEIARQCGLSFSVVEKTLRGKKGVVWYLPSAPPVNPRWLGGSQRTSMEIKRMRHAIGQNIWWLWSVVDEPVQRPGLRRLATVRPHRAIVEQAIQALALVCRVSEVQVWRWVYPGRAREIYRHTVGAAHTHEADAPKKKGVING